MKSVIASKTSAAKEPAATRKESASSKPKRPDAEVEKDPRSKLYSFKNQMSHLNEVIQKTQYEKEAKDNMITPAIMDTSQRLILQQYKDDRDKLLMKFAEEVKKEE